MWTSVGINNFKFTALVFLSAASLLFTSCKGADSGFAPGAITNPQTENPTTTSTDHVKYGETVTTSNGWEVSNDNTDPVDYQTLSNGWTVEVKYE